jgi:hypothetical protein
VFLEGMDTDGATRTLVEGAVKGKAEWVRHAMDTLLAEGYAAEIPEGAAGGSPASSPSAARANPSQSVPTRPGTTMRTRPPVPLSLEGTGTNSPTTRTNSTA